MRLDKIRLAGFKSFVDPTTIPLPGNLVAIVGPNGCGKSNIIDAVRWVMGESSAKHLRGESMADVIFNGSSGRKPVSVASVELVFDNADGTAPGEYAQYREISIKRQVSRDGQSSYFLNGARCRRKDITDLFLGTGLGARSYAIIEQGTISRLIEAKPDDLREVIEEAAGISKYKERRHETETRMRHTQENLERLQDVRDEVTKQLANLQRQAKKAEKYTELKAEERLYRLQLLAIRWRHHDRVMEGHREALQVCEQQFREQVGEENRLAEMLALARERQEAQQKQLHASQGEFYELGGEIGRLDQAIRHARQTRTELIRERERLGGEQAQAMAELEQDREHLDEAREEKLGLEAALDEAAEAVESATQARQAADQALRDWRSEWDSLRAELARLRAQVEMQKSRAQQLEDQRRQLEVRRERMQQEFDELDGALVEEELEQLKVELAEAEAEQAELRSRLERLAQDAREAREQAKDSQQQLNAVRAELHAVQGKISSLELLQQHAMGKDRGALKQWLAGAGLAEARRLAEHLEVSPGWETALETVLGAHLEAVCVSDSAAAFTTRDEATLPDSLALFETGREPKAANSAVAPSLADCVRAPWSLSSLLAGVYRADDLQQAQALSAGLADHESVVTPDGVWLGPGWLLLSKPDDGKAGMLKRERELRELKQQRDDLHARVGQLEQALSLADEAQRQAEFEREQRQSESNRLGGEITRVKSALSAASARAEQTRRRLQQLEFELDDIQESLVQNAEDLAETRTSQREQELELTGCERQAEAGGGRQGELENLAGEAEAALRTARDGLQAIKNRIENLRSTETLTLKHLERVQGHQRQTAERLAEIDRRLETAGAPMDEEEQILEELIEKRAVVERELAELRKRASETEAEVRKLDEQRMRLERERDALKQRLEQIKLDYQANDVRRQTVQEQFDELGVAPEQVLPELPEEAEDKAWQQRVNELVDEINRLGAINLTAMEEFQEQSERAQFLEQQHQDLSESLATLQQAIEKIDRECRARFKDTFDKVNAGIQRMFPKLFGGGQAYLELTERDLLESGVSVMARPPGKRNSSIHLLSGGEKALTAAALVFSIFELNPAPFCLLDEVDAPLDDANVGRFSQLVKEMSEKVQFLFISHNKATMEIAQHLAGVTMKEPGVSRIVAVDIDAAVELAGV
ncbi:chromosome segregation protein SMC [Methylococcus sp. EFPC2]|uniref:chromosome segregation protein SMC n=1 Tax=Methylococcus sp. EFPC2 TaxID=2812648 RepID=UPI001967FC9E|nr:chromosome segregation protein SMC [Methylococcus sp. EFPC2]QSA95714.1 chromosome segregation protein SMC [Methylococcus sp. EFPC2]